ncbi:MAG: hypothetical protein HZB24_11620 [Desulfobacterales bacterium]|nr:hypothetical protein [Desulfobacterales bacterium]
MMNDRQLAPLAVLSGEEQNDLTKMIGEFQQTQTTKEQDVAALQQQVETLNQRLAYLTAMFLTIDRRLKPLYEILQLTLEKGDVLDQRINTIIDSLRS